jgi:hypothetical protein
VPEIIDPVFAKTRPKHSFCMTENERFGLVFVKTGSINSGTGDFKCREVKTGFCRNRLMQTSSSETLNGWKSGQTIYVPIWDRMEGA